MSILQVVNEPVATDCINIYTILGSRESLEAAHTLEQLSYLLAERRSLKACFIKRISVSIILSIGLRL